MKFYEYLNLIGETANSYAKRTGLHQSTVWRMEHEVGAPRLTIALFVEKESQGKVKVKDLCSNYKEPTVPDREKVA